MRFTIINDEVMDGLSYLPDSSVNCCITSPPYWKLRDYGITGQIGMESTPEEYVERLVKVFREVRRALMEDGTLWLNLGDSYSSVAGKHNGREDNQKGAGAKRAHLSGAGDKGNRTAPGGLKPKDLIGIPWRTAFALQSDGWWLRSDIIWAKPAPMPESTTDRPTRSHEYLFLLAKSEKYYFDHEAIKEPSVSGHPSGNGYKRQERETYKDKSGARGSNEQWKVQELRHKRDVWTIGSEPYKGAHFAVFPTKLVEPCVLAGCPKEGTVLDPFCGSGTVGVVAKRAGRNFIGIDVNPEYCQMSDERIRLG